jgi:hypothetical protein
MRSTAEVLDHHMKCFAARDMEGVLANEVVDSGMCVSGEPSYSPSNVKCTSIISAISVITIERVPFRSNTIPLARTYLPTNGISFWR